MTPHVTHSPQPLSEETLKELERLLKVDGPGHWSGYGSTIYAGDSFICGSLLVRHEKLICALRNNAEELLRGYRLGIGLDKDRKP